MKTPTLALAVAASLLACSRPKPSPDYERARQLWTALVQQRGGDAAEDARADEVLALLQQVPAQSLDRDAAAELRERIEAARKASAEERERRDKLVESAGAYHAHAGAARGGAEPEPEPARAPQPLPRPRPLPGPGTKLEELRSTFGDCLEARGPVEILGEKGGQARNGEMWALKNDQACRQEHAQLVGQVLLVHGGALAGMNRESEIKRKEVLREVQVEKLPDGGMAERTPAGLVPLPPGTELRNPDGGAP